MCTLSWVSVHEGYVLWFNRDELNSRGLETPPKVQESQQGVAWLAPEDSDSGGTWLMVNAHGVTTVLLNRYGDELAQTPNMARVTRGRLVPLTATARTADEAIERVRREDLSKTLPFHLISIDAGGGVAELRWDGFAGHLAAGKDVSPPITSSSFRPEEVASKRRALFPTHPSPRSLREFHHEHDPAEGAVCDYPCFVDSTNSDLFGG